MYLILVTDSLLHEEAQGGGSCNLNSCESELGGKKFWLGSVAVTVHGAQEETELENLCGGLMTKNRCLPNPK